MKFIKNQQLGFTLIEMIVSLAVFSIVVTITVGALLVLVGTNQQLQDEQSVMTNLSFALDSMTREIRTGTHYFCETKNNNNNNIFDNSVNLNNPVPSAASDHGLDANEVQDCSTGRFPLGHRYHGIAFNEGGSSITGTGGRILYFFDEDEGKIFRRVGSGLAQSIVSSGIYITDAEFFVSGSNPLNNTEKDQTVVTIFIEAKDVNDPTAKAYQMQTTITQRTLDI
jgi:prepilin-type N-terminal cleavage/methylation domain-containing protein